MPIIDEPAEIDRHAGQRAARRISDRADDGGGGRARGLRQCRNRGDDDEQQGAYQVASHRIVPSLLECTRSVPCVYASRSATVRPHEQSRISRDKSRNAASASASHRSKPTRLRVQSDGQPHGSVGIDVAAGDLANICVRPMRRECRAQYGARSDRIRDAPRKCKAERLFARLFVIGCFIARQLAGNAMAITLRVAIRRASRSTHVTSAGTRELHQ